MRVFVTSDQHISHLNILKYANRPFVHNKLGLRECEELIVKNHNLLVNENDIVLQLGDIGFGMNLTEIKIKQFIKSLNGRHILIKGNHDNYSDEFYLTLFEDVYNFLIFDNVMISHYPCSFDPKCSEMEKEQIKMIQESETPIDTIYHGHIHNKNPDDCYLDKIKRINCCVDYPQNNFTPIEIFDSRIINFIENNF